MKPQTKKRIAMYCIFASAALVFMRSCSIEQQNAKRINMRIDDAHQKIENQKEIEYIKRRYGVKP